jgi:hypothetical protein
MHLKGGTCPTLSDRNTLAELMQAFFAIAYASPRAQACVDMPLLHEAKTWHSSDRHLTPAWLKTTMRERYCIGEHGVDRQFGHSSHDMMKDAQPRSGNAARRRGIRRSKLRLASLERELAARERARP